jgi:alpha-L-fucosidase
MFIHWGLYSLPAGEWKGKSYAGIGEWIMYNARIPVAEYEALAKEFNPTKFDAEAWVQLAQDAGMKYLVITARHHDGFAMFGSRADDFDIVDATPFRREMPPRSLWEQLRLSFDPVAGREAAGRDGMWWCAPGQAVPAHLREAGAARRELSA